MIELFLLALYFQPSEPLPRSSFAACNATDFSLNLNGVQCKGLTSVAAPTSAQECRDACCEQDWCLVWQWCRDGYSSCPLESCWIGSSLDDCATVSKYWEGGGRPLPTVCLSDDSSDCVQSCFDDTCSPWLDSEGNKIEAHAAGILQNANGRLYWYGESEKNSNLSTHGVNCYSADGLGGPWVSEGLVLSQTDIAVDVTGPYVIERPKVLYNEDTQMYVMWFHLDTSDYEYRHVGVATAEYPSGPFTFLYALQPDGIPSLDMSLFRDPQDGIAYFIRSCDNEYAGISRLTSDYLNTTGVISTHDVFEGMALFRLANGTYYAVTSHLTGWDPNPLMLYRAAGETLDDPQWIDMGNPTHDSTSFNTQPTYVVQLTDAGGTPYFMYMADNWVHGPGKVLINASYVWLPFDFRDNDVYLQKLTNWSMTDPFG